MTSSKPEMLIVGGPNGAGKTTLAKRFASSLDAEYVGADQIAFQLCPENPLSVRIQSAETFVGKILELIDSDQSFVVETTLSGKTFDQYIKRATNRGFQTTLAFVFLDSDELCVRRVASRVLMGGHHVPESDIRRRFKRSLANMWQIYRNLVDNWIIAYNGGEYLQDVAIGSRQTIAIRDENLFQLFLDLGGTTDNE